MGDQESRLVRLFRDLDGVTLESSPLLQHAAVQADEHLRKAYATHLAQLLWGVDRVSIRQIRLFRVLLGNLGLDDSETGATELLDQAAKLNRDDLQLFLKQLQDERWANSFLVDALVLARLERPLDAAQAKVFSDLAVLLQIPEVQIKQTISAVASILGLHTEDGTASATTPAVPNSVSSQQQSAYAAEVRPRIGLTGRYLDNGDGTVTDPETGLQWMRFSLGQMWTGTDCVLNAHEYSWYNALSAADTLNQRGGYAGYHDWRVPTVEELCSLVCCSSGDPGAFPLVAKRDTSGCRGNYRKPTIDLEAFPNTPECYFWSASSFAGYADFAWDVRFRYGLDGWSHKDYSLRVRLVRSAQ